MADILAGPLRKCRRPRARPRQWNQNPPFLRPCCSCCAFLETSDRALLQKEKKKQNKTSRQRRARLRGGARARRQASRSQPGSSSSHDAPRTRTRGRAHGGVCPRCCAKNTVLRYAAVIQARLLGSSTTPATRAAAAAHLHPTQPLRMLLALHGAWFDPLLTPPSNPHIVCCVAPPPARIAVLHVVRYGLC